MSLKCKSCGEEDRLRGSRQGDAIRIVCEVCGTSWMRDVSLKCRHCGSEHLRSMPIPIWGHGRGKMKTPTGTKEAWACDDCGEFDVTRQHDEGSDE